MKNLCKHNVSVKHCKVCKKVKESGGMSKEQIQNWRDVLVATFGIYARIMPVSEIVAYKKKMEQEIDKLAKEVVPLL